MRYVPLIENIKYIFQIENTKNEQMELPDLSASEPEIEQKMSAKDIKSGMMLILDELFTQKEESVTHHKEEVEALHQQIQALYQQIEELEKENKKLKRIGYCPISMEHGVANYAIDCGNYHAVSKDAWDEWVETKKQEEVDRMNKIIAAIQNDQDIPEIPPLVNNNTVRCVICGEWAKMELIKLNFAYDE